MRSNALSILFLLSFSTGLFSQTLIERESISAGERLSQHFIYLYPSFADASIKMKNQERSLFKMNVNLLLSELEFIDPKGDTLSVAQPEDIDSVFMNGSVFFYGTKGLTEIKQSSDSIKLGILRQTSYEVLKIGAMGIATRSAAVTSIRKLPGEYENTGVHALTLNESIDITKETNYVLFDAKGQMRQASKSNFQLLFPGLQKQIEEQVRLHKIKFNNETGLMQLLDFCLGRNSNTTL